MTQFVLLALIAVNCVILIINAHLYRKVKERLANGVGLTSMRHPDWPDISDEEEEEPLYVRGVNVSEQFNTILDQQGLRMHQTILPTAQRLSDAEAYEKIVEGSRQTFGTSKKAKP